jgi:hypothetical protein
MNIKLSKTSWVHPLHLSHHIHFPRPPILLNPMVSNGLGFPATALASVPRWTPPQRTARGVGNFWDPQLGSLQRKLGDSQNMSKRQRLSILSQVERSRVKKKKQISNFSEMWDLKDITSTDSRQILYIPTWQVQVVEGHNVFERHKWTLMEKRNPIVVPFHRLFGGYPCLSVQGDVHPYEPFVYHDDIRVLPTQLWPTTPACAQKMASSMAHVYRKTIGFVTA